MDEFIKSANKKQKGQGSKISSSKKIRKKSISLDKKKARAGYLFVLPFIVGFVLIYLPMIFDSILRNGAHLRNRNLPSRDSRDSDILAVRGDHPESEDGRTRGVPCDLLHPRHTYDRTYLFHRCFLKRGGLDGIRKLDRYGYRSG